jgi:hypothetical protein
VTLPLISSSTFADSPDAADRALTNPVEIDPDLAHVLAAWPELQPAIRRAVLALIDSAGPGDQSPGPGKPG